MRAVVSRVSTAAVTVAGTVVGEIGPGLLSLVGIGREDDAGRARELARKIAELRVFTSEAGAVSVSDLGLPVLVVSQFTLYGDCRKGRRPSFVAAAPPQLAEPLYEAFVVALKALGVPVATGRFAADMQVELVNDGPVTFVLETGE
jgi:D-aminoacyl-tRNA deacylase